MTSSVVVGGSTKPAGRPHVKRGGGEMIVTSLLHYIYSIALRKQPRRDSVFVYSVHYTSSQRVTVITLLPPFVNNTCCGMRRRADKHDRVVVYCPNHETRHRHGNITQIALKYLLPMFIHQPILGNKQTVPVDDRINLIWESLSALRYTFL